MATQQQCLAALTDIADRFNSHDAGKKRDRLPQRSVGVTILDLDITYKAELVGGYLTPIRQSQTHQADIRVLCSSDDLIALINGDLAFPNAWSTGRVRVDASFRDLMKLRALA